MPELPKFAKEDENSSIEYKGIPCFQWENVTKPTLIGSGSYGKVYHGMYQKQPVVLKVLREASEDELLKEARFHFRLKYPNLVEFKRICPTKRTLMLEYIFFDLEMFNGDGKVSSLDALLKELNGSKCKGFEHIIPSIAKDIVDVLSYLHQRGVAHRDLKPGNVLISNQHLLGLPSLQQEMQWRLKPCLAKLTDFGESWGKLAQSCEAACSFIANLYKGTPAFMAPEVIDPSLRPLKMGEEQLKLADIWSHAPILSCESIMSGPLWVRGKEKGVKPGKWQEFMKMKISTGERPEQDPNYGALRATIWEPVEDVFKKCTLKQPSKRITLENVDKTLFRQDASKTYHLDTHQGQALEEAQEDQLARNPSFTNPSELKQPQNDGTNACVFLCLKICEMILKDGCACVNFTYHMSHKML
eukprot:Seg3371.4 transcript_id=Seg3371.4/GoldUCD/mRNA.D3Y31 product="Leucine-rich repeat serine/threonine-protein kinase 2" protein_id=Seg3371.4/GoldUCD/D3Y31